MNSDQTVTYGVDTYRPDYEAGIPGENNLKTIGEFAYKLWKG